MSDYRYDRDNGAQGDGYAGGVSRDYTGEADAGYSSAREYEAAGRLGQGGQGRYDRAAWGQGRGGYGRQDYGRDQDYRSQKGGGRDQGYRGDQRYAQGGGEPYRGSYASDGRRFEDVDRDRNSYGRRDEPRRDDGRPPQGNASEDRGFIQRAGDEVRSWFGDEDAERRRREDEQRDERQYGAGAREQGRHGRDFGREHDDYHDWRSQQIAAFDRDYDEYRTENRSRFHQEFGAWRTEREGQRGSLSRVKEHMEVVGADGQHVGVVDHVRDDRLLLTKNDAAAGGHHHSIPSRWISSVDERVVITKTADEAKQLWRDEESKGAMFGGTQHAATGQAGAAQGGASGQADARQDGGTDLNRSFPGTY